MPPGKVTSFPQAVKSEPHETVVTGIVEWPSKAVHDAGMPKVGEAMMAGFKDGTLREPPFDGIRIVMGEFEVLLDA
ncbi:DUF1428 family protein [Tropicimonas sp. IMCC6043]|uniref:DUF1428 family protein n=1 Tax=Tropicimonas sp. IMCC6043 TaxID=2510645 RepID=UPI001A9184C8